MTQRRERRVAVAASASPTDKGKPGATQGRKATGPFCPGSAGLPKGGLGLARRYLVIAAIIGVLVLPLASPLANPPRKHLGPWSNQVPTSQRVRHQGKVHTGPWTRHATAPLPPAHSVSDEMTRSGHPGRIGQSLGGFGKWLNDKLSDAKQLWGRIFERTNDGSLDQLAAAPPVGGYD